MIVTSNSVYKAQFLMFFSRFVETDGKGYDRVRRTEIGKKNFKLTHFEEVRFKFFTINQGCIDSTWILVNVTGFVIRFSRVTIGWFGYTS